MINFKLFNELSDQEIKKVEKIFFDTSSVKEFESDISKDNFLYKYLNYYQHKHPQLFLCIFHQKEVAGYICGSRHSQKDHELYELLPHFNLFKEHFHSYPAHLHVNVSPFHHGKGLGSKLISQFEKLLKEQSVKGVHLITSVDSQNVSFYKKNQYNFSSIKSIDKRNYLFLGKKLSN